MFNFKVSHRTNARGSATPGAVAEGPDKGSIPSRGDPALPGRASSSQAAAGASLPPRQGLGQLMGARGKAAEAPFGEWAHAAQNHAQVFKRLTPEEQFDNKLQSFLKEYPNKEVAVTLGSYAMNGDFGKLKQEAEAEAERPATAPEEKKLLASLLRTLNRMLGVPSSAPERTHTSALVHAAPVPQAAVLSPHVDKFNTRLTALVDQFPNRLTAIDLATLAASPNGLRAFKERLVDELNKCLDPEASKLLLDTASAARHLQGHESGLRINIPYQ
ncbi:MAG TPA: hypothetical protein VIN58_19230 [Roseateles sp.]